MEQKLGIVFVVTNEKHNLEMLFDSLRKQTYKNFTIYFVDNNSSDGSFEFSEKLNNQRELDIKYSILKENAGFAKGNNIGAEAALKDGCKYIFVLNNDTELDSNCLKELVTLIESDDKIGVTAPIFFFWNSDKKQNKIQEYGGSIDFKKYLIRKNFEGKIYEEVKEKIPEVLEVSFVSGGTTFLKSELFQKIGLWEERYFGYGDEIDFSKRVVGAGYKLFVTKKAKVWHNHIWTKKNKQGYYFEYYSIQRNKYLYFKKFRLRYCLCISLAKDLILFPYRLIWFNRVCDMKLGYFYLKGTIDGLRNKTGKPKLKSAQETQKS